MWPWMLALLIALPRLGLGAPSWFTENGQRFSGSFYEVSCRGSGPSAYHARQEALDQCRLTAASAIQSKIGVSSVSIQTERDVALHEQVSQRQEYSGLVCDPIREAIEETETQSNAWITCRFDLGKVTVAEESAKSSGPAVALSNKRRVTIATVPACESILIEGSSPRIIRCNTNPQTFLLKPGDTKLIIRAIKHLPKELPVSELPESLDIVLEGL